VRRREERRVPTQPEPEPKQWKARKGAPRTKPPAPSELERLEAEISDRETTVADLERRLAEDWTDTETLAAHRQARDELRALLDRWETVFERAQS
jgi:hypothetical protein